MKPCSSPRVDQHAARAVLDVDRRRARAERDDEQRGGQRFQRHVAEGFGRAREQEDVGRRVVLRERRTALLPDEDGIRRLLAAGAPAADHRRRPPCGAAGYARADGLVRTKRQRHVLLRRQPADVQQHRCRRSPRPTPRARSRCAAPARTAGSRRRGRSRRAARSPCARARAARRASAPAYGPCRCESGAGTRARRRSSSRIRSGRCTRRSWCGSRM